MHFLAKNMQTASVVCSYRHFRVRTRSAYFGKKLEVNPAGFSTITFFAFGREIRVHGFLQREVREMKELVEGR